MAPSNQDDFDGYRKWLGITNKKRLPTHYEVLAISLDEDDPEVIRAASEQRRHYVESKRGEGHDAVVTEILYRIGEAEATLLNDEMRRDYDRQLNLFEKRRKNRQVDPYAPRSRVRSRPGKTVGEDGGIVRTFIGIMAVVCVGFGIIAWFSFGLSWHTPKQADVKPTRVEQPNAVQPPAQSTDSHPAQPIAQEAVAQPPVLPVEQPRQIETKPTPTIPDKPEVVTLEGGHTGYVARLVFSRDGKKLVSGSFDGTVKVWDVESRTVLSSFSKHSNGISSIDVSPDGATVASAGADNSVRLFDVVSGEEKAKFEQTRVTRVLFLPDGKTWYWRHGVLMRYWREERLSWYDSGGRGQL